MKLLAALSALPLLIATQPATAQILGQDSAACEAGGGPAILATLTGLKDRKGTVKLELYPANAADFLKDDRDLIAQGKLFRRIKVSVPASGAVQLCVRVPRAGRYALFAGHDRDGKNKFNFFTDGAGFPSNNKLGMSRPKLQESLIEAGAGVTATTIRMQYLRGLGGFGPTGG